MISEITIKISFTQTKGQVTAEPSVTAFEITPPELSQGEDAQSPPPPEVEDSALMSEVPPPPPLAFDDATSPPLISDEEQEATEKEGLSRSTVRRRRPRESE